METVKKIDDRNSMSIIHQIDDSRMMNMMFFFVGIRRLCFGWSSYSDSELSKLRPPSGIGRSHALNAVETHKEILRSWYVRYVIVSRFERKKERERSKIVIPVSAFRYEGSRIGVHKTRSGPWSRSFNHLTLGSMCFLTFQFFFNSIGFSFAAVGLAFHACLLLALVTWRPAGDDPALFNVISAAWGVCNAVWETLIYSKFFLHSLFQFCRHSQCHD